MGHHFGVRSRNVAADLGTDFRLVVPIAVRWFTAALISSSKNVYEHAASTANNDGAHFKSEIGGGLGSMREC